MKLTKRLLEAINSGIRMGLELGDDEDTLRDVNFNKTIINKSNNAISSGANAYIYSKELQEMLQDPMAINKKFIKLALKYNKEYGATYNPHLDGEGFKAFIQHIMQIFNYNINLNWVNTSEVTDMSCIFSVGLINKQIHPIFKINISDWDVSNVVSMYGLFQRSKFNGDISKWDVSNVKDMSKLFYKCEIFNGDISNWDVSNVTDMHYMFCDSNFNGDISNWDVSNVKDMSKIFEGSFFNKDISIWDVSHVNNAFNAFRDCPIKEEYKPKFK